MLVSQLPIDLDLAWRAGDPVSLSVLVEGLDWSGAWTGAVGGQTLTVTASYDGTDTTVTFTLSSLLSTTLGDGKHFFWAKDAGGITKFSGFAKVAS